MKKKIDSNEVKTDTNPKIITINNNLRVIDESGKIEYAFKLFEQLEASGELYIFEERERKRKEEYEKAQKES
ncbi:hypothetical protein QK342_05175 [Myroides odoratimimus]|uniref:hypothetical protein n=1 Tax=Myroides odoratimimus TaxID=76832 RepID=UPI00103A353C|nr:hypothetical protein [Myroides odoratimimus]QBK75755.1 hypothetical protein E0Z07_05175 [Myroides odoratimimus]WHT74465.1 hypothetical protein QK342_05175 [Myroides odoratimimus]WHU39047.1 hypothetical protein QNM93_05170 [Myroides odoratimimus]